MVYSRLSFTEITKKRRVCSKFEKEARASFFLYKKKIRTALGTRADGSLGKEIFEVFFGGDYGYFDRDEPLFPVAF